MTQFKYQAIDSGGSATSGHIDAGSLPDATDELRRRGISNIVSIEADDVERERRFPTRYEPIDQRPPPAPRNIDLPISQMPGGWIFLIMGLAFVGIPGIIILVGLGVWLSGAVAGLFMVLFPLIHLSIGAAMLRYVLGTRARMQRLYRSGDVTMATVEDLAPNRNMRVNGRNPSQLTWTFDLDGKQYTGKRSSFNHQMLTHQPGDRIWVLYDPADPKKSTAWPPLSVNY